MNDIFKQMEADANPSSDSSEHRLSNEDLSTLTGLAEAILRQEEYVSNLEDQTKEEKKKLIKMSDEDLPNMMEEVGCSKFVLTNGEEVSVKPLYGGSIRVDNREEAFKWLRDNGHGDYIKNQVFVSFGSGEDELALDFKEHCKKFLQEKKLQLPVEQVEKVEPSTLRKFIKEMIEGTESSFFPTELFGAFIGQRAVIKKAKGGKNG